MRQEIEIVQQDQKTSIPIYLSENKDMVKRIEQNELILNEAINAISPHLYNDADIYLVVSSKANMDG